MSKSFRITIFLSLSLAWSGVYFGLRPFQGVFEGETSALVVVLGLVPAVGLAIAGSVMRTRLPQAPYSLLGNSQWMSVVAIFMPVLGLAIVGVENPFGMQAHLFGFVVGLNLVVYALLEELGWRGYLQAEFAQDKSPWIGWLLIGTAWWLWHWFFLRDGNPRWGLLPALIGASAGLGQVVALTRSVLMAAAFHTLGNILLMYSLVANALSWTEKGIVVGLCLLVWGPMMWRLGKKEETREG